MSFTFVAFVETSMVGAVFCTMQSGNLLITSLAVKAVFRNNGIGRVFTMKFNYLLNHRQETN